MLGVIEGRYVADATVAGTPETAPKCSTSNGLRLVQTLMKDSFTMSNRLATIATAQKQTRVRDLVFACFVALAAIVSVSSVSTAAHAAAPTAQR